MVSKAERRKKSSKDSEIILIADGRGKIITWYSLPTPFVEKLRYYDTTSRNYLAVWSGYLVGLNGERLRVFKKVTDF
jgi:hypothetical protein